MKRAILYTGLLLAHSIASLAEHQISHQDYVDMLRDNRPIFVNIIDRIGSNNSAQITSSNVNQHTSTTTSNATHKQELPESTTGFALPQFKVPEIELNLQKHSTSAFSWCCDHKWKLIAGATLTLYGYFRYKLSSHIEFLRSSQAWCNWKQTLSLGQIVVTPQQDLIQALKIDLLKKYHLGSSSKSSTPDMYDLFMADIKQEEQFLDWYTSFYQVAKRLCIAHFYSLEINLQAIAEKKARLAFVTELFSSWYATQHM